MEYSAGQITGAAVSALMKSLDVDEHWLAKKLGVKVPYVYGIKKGKSMSLEQCKKVATLFGCKLSQFIDIGEKNLERTKEKN
ncbi:Cro/C1-type helix-turn-helix domain protein [Vibrio phage 1.254.O._10N.286.45.C8]|nr:Cro/C1-type helix-turn-helix domain protein [Vibrio phage 1.254.O._10N.286.45.C8]